MSLNIIAKLLVLLLLPLLFTAVSCNKPTEPTTGNVTITVEDASCTEVWLKITAGSNAIIQDYILYENDNKKLDITLKQRDTVIAIENLLPKHNYRYKLMNSNNVSNETLAITLDTTSHNFTWQTFEFGQHSSSVLYDVAIIDENNIWAVGEIYMNDPLGNPDPTFYNAVHWNGTDWELKKIFYKGGIWTIRTIFAFNGNDIWFSGYMRYLNGQFIELTIPNILMGWQINKLWGSSSNDLYVVGNNGNIAHWNGSSWKKIESPTWTSGTTLNLQDIWGDINIKHNTKEIICIAANIFTNQGTKVIKIDENVAKELSGTGLTAYSSGIWFKSGRKYYVVGGGVQTKTNVYNSAGWYRFPDGIVNDYYSYKVTGTALNDIFIVGTAGKVIHYNGSTWKKYSELFSEQVEYNGISSKNNKIVIVGDKGARACIAVGRK